MSIELVEAESVSEAQQGTIIPDTMVVNVTNNHPTETFVGKWRKTKYRIPPGETRMVPYYAAVRWFGDPRAINIGSKRSTQHRAHEIQRLSTLYGVYGQPWEGEPNKYTDEMIEKDPRPYLKGRHPSLPLVTVTDPTTNKRVYTVIEDPEGTRANTSTSKTPAESAQIMEMVSRMQTQQDQMLATLAEINPEAAVRLKEQMGSPAGTPVTPDDPTIEQVAGESDIPTDQDLANGLSEVDGDPQPDPTDVATVDGAAPRPRLRKAGPSK